MKKLYRQANAAVLLSAATLAAQPCLAAPDYGATGQMERRSGAFAGAVFKVPLGGAVTRKPSARLQLGMSHVYQDRHSSAPPTRLHSSVLEFGLTDNGKPLWLVGGQSTEGLKQRLGISGSTKTVLLIVGGVAAAALAVVLLTEEQECPIPEGGC